jgi:Cu(I)/Ag(I) efflux system membrane fusion protein/cobalt-zinc-cadmium efflux system membrane fusion protein
MSDNHDTNSRRPRRGRRILINLGWVLGGAVLTLLLVADPLDLHSVDTWIQEALHHSHRDGRSAAGGEAEAAEGQLWTCGMHPQVISEEPGQCPICRMDLVPLGMDAPDHDREAAGGGEREVLFYRNPHDPTVTSPVPAKDAMGMDYVPVYADRVDQAAAPGVVRIDPAVVQNMNVQTALVERRDLSKPIRTVGYLDYDPQQMVTVTTKYSGFIEKVLVNYVGEPVRRGQPLFEIYSPELVQTQQELLSARSFARRLENAPEETRGRAEALAAAARARLAYWDISEAQIARLEESGQTFRTLTVAAPASGLVMKRMPGMEGMGVKPGMELFHIADLSSLWLSVEIYEDQLPWLRAGSQAEITLSYFPGETFRGKVRFVEPQMQEKTRTVGLRVEVPNPDGKLVAGMYATVRFDPLAAEDAVVVPRQAVIRSGKRNLLIVALGEGRFAPREITLGAEGDDDVQVLAGVEPGETIVTSSQFLIDSESNLRAAIQKLIGGRNGAGSAPPVPAGDHAGHG